MPQVKKVNSIHIINFELKKTMPKVEYLGPLQVVFIKHNFFFGNLLNE